MFFFTPIVRNLLIINVVIFVLRFFIHIDFFKLFGLHCLLSDSFQPYQLLTNIFIHADFSHLFSNMIGLLVFGSMLEEYIGSRKFLFLYLFTGYAACVLYAGIDFLEMWMLRREIDNFLLNPSPELFAAILGRYDSLTYYYEGLYNFIQNIYPAAPDDWENIEFAKKSIKSLYYTIVNNSYLIGASGAVFGVMMGAVLFFPNREMILIFFPFFPIKMKYLIATYAAWEIYALIENRPNDNVAHFVHISGMIFGFLLIRYWQRKRAI
ncbi:MAG: rhomboid family intramembrane serine protease [Flammeovirgaceae bacterium]|nr:rhomboid family intramembrane serine protease [Flammeovirgaceae bacterium]MDW8286702.1 rhomboid family intramembrane serine protease [Flammeovirgaceae bacterium]